MAWTDIVDDPRFINLSPERQRKMADIHFDETIRSDPRWNNLSEDRQNKMEGTFLSSIGQSPDPLPPQPPEVPPLRSFKNAFVTSLGPEAVSDLVGIISPESALEMSRANFEKRPYSGTAGFLGESIGQTIPSIPAVAAKTPYGALAASVGVISYYMLRSFGSSRKQTAAYEQETGEDVPLSRDIGAAILNAGAEGLIEKWGLGKLGKVISMAGTRGVTGAIRSAFKRGNVKEIAKAIMNVGPDAIAAAGIEGGEEGVTSLVQNLIDKVLYDPKRAITEGLGRSILGGAVGGGFIAPIGIGYRAAFGKPGLEEKFEVSEAAVIGEEGKKLRVASRPLRTKINTYLGNIAAVYAEPTPDNIAAKEESMADMHVAWLEEHPDDVNGDFLGQLLSKRKVGKGTMAPEEVERVQAAMAKTTVSAESATKRVKLTSEQHAEDSINFITNTGQAVRVTKDKSTKKTVFERVLTALNVASKDVDDVLENTNRVHVTGATPSGWIKGLINMIAPGVDYAAAKKALGTKGMKLLRDEFGDKFGAIQKDANGKFTIVIKSGGLASKLGEKTSSYAYMLAHEFEHGRLSEELTEDEIVAAKEDGTQEKKASKAALDAFNKLKALDAQQPKGKLEFQISDQILVKEEENNSISRFRLLHGVQGAFNKIVQSTGQLYSEDGTEVNAAVDPETGTLYLSDSIDPTTIGHEAGEMLIAKLGVEHELIQEGLSYAEGNKETLLDMVGKYYANTELNTSNVARIGEWLRRTWAAVKNTFGMEQTRTDILSLFNSHITNLQAPKVEGAGLEFQVRGERPTKRFRVLKEERDQGHFFAGGQHVFIRKGVKSIPNVYYDRVATALEWMEYKAPSLMKRIGVNIKLMDRGEATEQGIGKSTAGFFSAPNDITLIPTSRWVTTSHVLASIAHELRHYVDRERLGVQKFEALFDRAISAGTEELSDVRFERYLAQEGEVRARGLGHAAEADFLVRHKRGMEFQARKEGAYPIYEHAYKDKTTNEIEGIITQLKRKMPKVRRRGTDEDIRQLDRDIVATEAILQSRKFAERRVVIPAAGEFNFGNGTRMSWLDRGNGVYSITEYSDFDPETPVRQYFLPESSLEKLMEAQEKGLEFQRRKALDRGLKITEFASEIFEQAFETTTKLIVESPKKKAKRKKRKHKKNMNRREISDAILSDKDITTEYTELKSVINMLKRLDQADRDFMSRTVLPMMDMPGRMDTKELAQQAYNFADDKDLVDSLMEKLRSLGLSKGLQIGGGLTPLEHKVIQIVAERQIKATRIEMVNSQAAGDMAAVGAVAKDMLFNERLRYINLATPGRAVKGFDWPDQTDQDIDIAIAEAIQAGKMSDADLHAIVAAQDAFNTADVRRIGRKYKDLTQFGRWEQTKNLTRAVFYEGILSGMANPKNFFSNAMWLAYQIPSRGVRAMTDATLSHPIVKGIFPAMKERQRKYYFAEMGALWRGLSNRRSMQTALKVAKLTWDTGVMPENLTTKWNMEIGHITDTLERAGFSEKWARYLSPFTRTLIVTDLFFKSIAADAQMQALIVRDMQRTGKDFADIEVTDQMTDEALEFSNMVTFMDNPGAVAKSAGAVRRAISEFVPGGWVVIPFVNTLANIFDRAMEKTPGIGVWKGWKNISREAKQKKIGWWDTKSLPEALANQMEGAVLAMVLLLLLDEDRVTGEAPKNSAQRRSFFALGKKPHAFKVGDQWISYRQVEPFNIVISNIVAVRDAMKRSPEDTWDETFFSFAHGVATNLSRNTYIDNIYRAIESGWNMKEFAKGIPAGFVPYSGFWRQINRSYEASQDGGRYIRSNHELTSAMANALPWFVTDAIGITPPPRIDALGEEVLIPGGVLKQWMPLQWQASIDDPVEQELDRLQIYPGLPSRRVKIRGQEVVLPIEFYRDYSILYGKGVKEAIDKAIKSPSYHRREDQQKARGLSRAIARAQTRARKKAYREYYRSYMRVE